MKRHAILITAHSNRSQLEQLLGLLDHEGNDIYLLVDAKGDLGTLGLATRNSELFILPAYNLYWAGFSLISATLDLLRAATRRKYHYYHYITGADLPLTRPGALHAFLEASDLEYVDFTPEYQDFAHFKAGYYHFLMENRYYRRSRLLHALRHACVRLQALVGVDRARRNGEVFYHGSAYFSITHGLAEYVLDHQAWIERTFRHGLACEEVFLQTLVMKSPFRERLSDPGGRVTANLRYIDWSRRDKNSPYTFRAADIQELREARSRSFFARKFDPRIDDLIIKKVIEMVEEETP